MDFKCPVFILSFISSKSRPSIFGCPFKRTQFATQPDKYNQLYYFAIIIRALFSVIVKKTPKIEPWEWTKNRYLAAGLPTWAGEGGRSRNLGRQLMTGIPVRFTFSG